jgi:hypothetical protein
MGIADWLIAALPFIILGIATVWAWWPDNY